METNQNQWQQGELLETKMVSKNIRSLTFKLPDWEKHEAGQFYDIRIRKSDGSVVERNYSVASAPEEEGIVEFGVELIEGGEISPYLFQMNLGEKVEMRGPFGKYFNWNIDISGELCLIAGGSGIVPIISILRHHFNNLDQNKKVVLLGSFETEGDVPYKQDLENFQKKSSNFNFVKTITQEKNNLSNYDRRIDLKMLKEVFRNVINKEARFYVCGGGSFVGEITKNLLNMGYSQDKIMAEIFN